MGLTPGIKFSAVLVYTCVEWGIVKSVFLGSQHSDPNEGLVADLSIVRNATLLPLLTHSLPEILPKNAFWS